MSRYVVWTDLVGCGGSRESADDPAKCCSLKSPDGAYFCTLPSGHGVLPGDMEIWHIAHAAKTEKLAAWADGLPRGTTPDRYHADDKNSTTRPKPDKCKQLFAPIQAPAFTHPRTAMHNGDMKSVRVVWEGVDEWDLLPDANQEEQEKLPHLDDRGELTTIENLLKERAWPPKGMKS